MRFLTLSIAIGFLLLSLTVTLAEAAEKYAGDFLKVGAGARAAAFGGSFIALGDDATAGYWNPGTIPRLKGKEAIFEHSERFGGIIKKDFAGFAFSTKTKGGFGVNILRIDTGEIKYTKLQNPKKEIGPQNRPIVSQKVRNTDYALWLSYGKFLREDLSVGASLKLIRRQIGQKKAFGDGLDLGILYTPFEKLSLGLTLYDITSTKIIWEGNSKDTILPSAQVATAYSLMIQPLDLKITGTLGWQLNSSKEEKFPSGGIELSYRHTVDLRLGSHLGSLTAGAGLKIYKGVKIDYAFLPHNSLANTHRVSLSFDEL